jgi:hypothetical protein
VTPTLHRSPMRYVVSLSGGLASAVAAERAIQRYGRQNVVLRFADTRWEDEDLARFKADLMSRWGGEIVHLAEGRTPLEVAEDKQIIPNGEPDFRVLEHERVLRAIKRRLCGMCGQKITGNVLCFIGADGNLLERRATDPAMHEACARYALAACPFLSGRAVRRSGKPLDGPGKTAYRSPALYDRERPPRAGLFFTRSYEARWRSDIRGFRYAPPFRVEWIDL